MTTTINAATSGGLIQTADTSGILALQTAGTTAVTIDASQNVLIGTASAPGTGQLQVVRNANDGSTRLLVSNSSAGSSAASFILFGNDTAVGGYAGLRASSSTNTSYGGANYIDFFNNLNGLSFSTNGVQRMSIPNAGGVQAVTCVSVGNATPSSSGAGITFPATQSASSDANTLDDYEEGTWTPVIGGSATYSNQYGRYTKIGNFVKIRFLLEISVKGTGSSTTITGMPYAPSSNAPTITGGVVCYATNLATSANNLGVYCQNNSANIYFFSRDSAGTGATTQQPAVIGNGFVCYAEISYMVD